MELSLPADLERALTEQARRQGMTPERFALSRLRQALTPASEESPHDTLAHFLGGHLGTLHSGEHVPGGAHLSERTGERFARDLAEKRAEASP